MTMIYFRLVQIQNYTFIIIIRQKFLFLLIEWNEIENVYNIYFETGSNSQFML